MKWALGKEQPAASYPQELSKVLDKCPKKNYFFLSAIQALLHFINDFSLDIKELKSVVFKKHLTELETELIPARAANSV